MSNAPLMEDRDRDRDQERDRRIGRLEGIVEQLDRRLSGIERRVARVQQSVDALGQQLNGRFDVMMRWMVGLFMACFLATISLLVTILLKLP